MRPSGKKGRNFQTPSHIPACSRTPALGEGMRPPVPATYFIPSIFSGTSFVLICFHLSFRSPEPVTVRFSHLVPSPHSRASFSSHRMSPLHSLGREAWANGPHSPTSPLPTSHLFSTHHSLASAPATHRECFPRGQSVPIHGYVSLFSSRQLPSLFSTTLLPLLRTSAWASVSSISWLSSHLYRRIPAFVSVVLLPFVFFLLPSPGMLYSESASPAWVFLWS